MSKKYQNCISKPQTVTIATWEYAALVRASTMLEAAEKLLNGLDEYRARDALKALLTGERKEVEE